MRGSAVGGGERARDKIEESAADVVSSDFVVEGSEGVVVLHREEGAGTEGRVVDLVEEGFLKTSSSFSFPIDFEELEPVELTVSRESFFFFLTRSFSRFDAVEVVVSLRS